LEDELQRSFKFYDEKPPVKHSAFQSGKIAEDARVDCYHETCSRQDADECTKQYDIKSEAIVSDLPKIFHASPDLNF
jgi:hypothetical protein